MEDVSITLLPLVRIAVVVTFLALAATAVARARRGGAAGGWLAASFVAGAGALAGAWGPDIIGVDPPPVVEDVWILLLVAFPYLLLRFTASFRDIPRALETGALAALLVAVLLMTFAGDAGAIVTVLTYWIPVSLVTTVRLWRAGRDQPTVARRRMRLMGAATALLAVGLLLTVEPGSQVDWVDWAVPVMALGSAVAFGLGSSPPRALRLAWRRHEEEYLQAGTMGVLRATSPEAVASELLPPTTAMVGGSGAALVDADGRVVAAHGNAPAAGDDLAATDTDGSREVVELGNGRGRLVVWTSPYTPFFGPEEIGLLRTMGAIAGLALERCELLDEERTRRVALERAQQESERAREEANRANTAKSEFLSRMSHELRTPLNAILGFGQLLETSPLSEEDQEGVGHILKAGRHLLALINDVLDLSRIEAGTLTISPEPVHSGELVHDTLALIRPLANSRAIRLVTDDEPCDVHVMTDRQRCRQVLLNLLSNAVKYNHDGGSVEVQCSQPSDETLRIAVRDTGPGINVSQQAQLFEPFERLGAERSTVDGTGLGLALTKQLVERLGGAIGVDSAPGQGSTFWIDLPVTEPASEPEDLPAPEAQPVSAGHRTLLLVEDNLANLRVVEAMLRRRPEVTVLPAMQGGLALELAYEHRPDVIVLDLHLPDLTGREVLSRLRADGRTRDIPVIVATADATPSRGRQLLEEGAFDYITKPLDLERFLAVVDAALGAATDVEGV